MEPADVSVDTFRLLTMMSSFVDDEYSIQTMVFPMQLIHTMSWCIYT